TGGESHNVLVVREAELTFGPAALSTGGTAAVRATIRFKSSVTDADGRELGRISGEVYARDAATSPTAAAMTANASQAIEAMYEEIGNKIAHPSDLSRAPSDPENSTRSEEIRAMHQRM